MNKFLTRKTTPFVPKEGMSLGELVRAFAGTSFQSRNLGACVEVYGKMLSSPDVSIMMGLAGAMVPAGMGAVVAELVRMNMIDVLVSTGANLYHDLHEGMGGAHYIGSSRVSDDELRQAKVDRIYDTFASDDDFIVLDAKAAALFGQLEPRAHTTREVCAFLGAKVEEGDSILRACHETDTPVFCPTFHDSGLGISMAKLASDLAREGKPAPTVDLILDNRELLSLFMRATEKGRTGVIFIGGGVPKNYIQQLGPMADIVHRKDPADAYAIQITGGDPEWGGLSGCTFQEAVSWGKVHGTGDHATVYVDATIGLPILACAAMELFSDEIASRPRRRFEWKDGEAVGYELEPAEA